MTRAYTSTIAGKIYDFNVRVDRWTEFDGCNLRVYPQDFVTRNTTRHLNESFEAYSTGMVPTIPGSGFSWRAVMSDPGDAPVLADVCAVQTPPRDVILNYTCYNVPGVGDLVIQSHQYVEGEGNNVLLVDNKEEESGDIKESTKAVLSFPQSPEGSFEFYVFPNVNQSREVETATVSVKFKLQFQYGSKRTSLFDVAIYRNLDQFLLNISSGTQSSYTTYNYDLCAPRWLKINLDWDLDLYSATLRITDQYDTLKAPLVIQPSISEVAALDTDVMNSLEFEVHKYSNNRNISSIAVDGLKATLVREEPGAYVHSQHIGTWKYPNGTSISIYPWQWYHFGDLIKPNASWANAPWWYFRFPVIIPTNNYTETALVLGELLNKTYTNPLTLQPTFLENSTTQSVTRGFNASNSITNRGFYWAGRTDSVETITFRYDASDNLKTREIFNVQPDSLLISYSNDPATRGVLTEIVLVDGDVDSNDIRDFQEIFKLEAEFPGSEDIPGFSLGIVLACGLVGTAWVARRRKARRPVE